MDREGGWRLAPTYDLTYTQGPNGEHKTMVSGVGRNPGRRALERLGAMAGLDRARVAGIIDRTLESVSGWRQTAGEAGVPPKTVAEVAQALDSVSKALDKQ